MYIFKHSRPNRPSALVDATFEGGMSTTEFNKLVLDVWSDTEFPNENTEDWDYLWDNFSTNSEQSQQLDLLFKEPRVLYRGGLHPGRSWTTDPSIAEWFSKRWGEEQGVQSRVFTRDEVIVYINDRDEKEVVVKI